MMRLILVFFVIFSVFFGCSTKKNSFKNRTYHKMTSWFNILHNGQEAIDNKLESLAEETEDDFSEILTVKPYPNFVNKEFDLEDQISIANTQDAQKSFLSRVGSGNTNILNNQESTKTGFEKAEEKAAKAIKKHSMEILGLERNKMMSRAYLMLGQARYYQGKSFQALEALNFAKDNFVKTKHDPKIELFLGLSHLQAGNKTEAEKILAKLYYDEQDVLKKKLDAEVAAQVAQHLIQQKKYKGATEALEKSIELTKNKKTRARYHYILGQLYTQLGQLSLANDNYLRVYKLKPGFNWEVKAKVALAENFSPDFQSYGIIKKDLLKTKNKGNYLSRQNEFDYAIAHMALKQGNLKETKEFLDKSLSQEASDPFIRSKTYSTYAKYSLNQKNYVHASAYYDSAYNAMPYEKAKELLGVKKKKLNDIIDFYYLVEKNDSILRIANLPKEKQESFFTQYIEKLKEEDKKKQEEQEEQYTEFQTQTAAVSFNQTFSSQDKNKFYFYNNNAISFGENEFKRIWGNFPLRDNWRSSKQGTTANEIEAELLGQNKEGDTRRYDLSFYLDKIPSSPKILDSIKIERDTTQLKLGIGYFDVLDDADLAIETLEKLIDTPPKVEETKQLALYNLFKIAKQSKNAKENQYKNQVLDLYPNSIYAAAILNPEKEIGKESNPKALESYEKAYEAYLEKKYNEFATEYNHTKTNYPKDPIIPKFELLQAYVLAKTKGEAAFMAAVKKVSLVYASTLEGKKAKELYNQRLKKSDGKNKQKQKAQPKNQSIPPKKKRLFNRF